MRPSSALLATFVFGLLAACTTTKTIKNMDPAADPGAATDPAPGGGADDGEGDDQDEDPGVAPDPAADAGSSKKPGSSSGGGSSSSSSSSSGGSSGSSSGSSGGGSGGGVDRTACVGTATSIGTTNGATPNVHQGIVQVDPTQGLQLVMMPNAANIAANDIVVGVYFTPIPGQLDYNPTGAVGCAILRYTGAGWQVVDKTQLCEVHLTTLQHASAANVCDGTIAGRWNGIFAANQPLAGTFVLPSNVPASAIKAPSCRPRDSVCSKHGDCCSQSCSPVLGICQ